ncbi:MAG: DUF2442 domain-containing protein [Luteitalea sp.]|nr:DUF2442 domain-containing protein [Luteitalea sp.]
MACRETQIDEGCCHGRFGAAPTAGIRSREIGRTVRGELVIADVDADGHIVGIELVGGPPKPCQDASSTTTRMDRVSIQSVEALPGYRLRLGLFDGRTVERDLSHLVPGPDAHPDNVFRPWVDPAYFAQVRVDPELETVVWPNGVDLGPDVLIWGVGADGNLLAPSEPVNEHA